MRNTPVPVLHFVPQPLDNLRLAHLCGPLDENLRQISAALDLSIFRRGDKFIVSGHNADKGVELLEKFYAQAKKIISIDEVQLALVEQRASSSKKLSAEQGFDSESAEAGANQKAPSKTRAKTNAAVSKTGGVSSARKKAIPLDDEVATATVQDQNQDQDDVDIDDHDVESPILKTRRSDLRGRTPHQNTYLRAILEHDITFGIGPAGTGKTYLAVACAVDALERDAVKRIVLTRPAVEAGERLGFLPGDLTQKVDPYLRPLYDALYDLLGFDRTQKMFEKQIIEIAPLAYMRGRTLNHSFIILDEAQNTTPEQMKMFLTRIGFGSKAVITGDVTQIDLQRHQRSGLVDACQVLKGVRGIAFNRFTSVDVVRHPLVARIVDAYEEASQQHEQQEAEIVNLKQATAISKSKRK
ncbi:PhoH family protein [Undibacterium cyanobacteriorum]|uniref:PhoH-like protein n=1 Tax=Undibacterium cyanobacteriorum TaxID=3073561 RepID=A0ABY9RLD5_9BURK|nr:PhoH family protein [Undibacterium sp. 20NA77.5]WMW81673.1 PhoH family protein [Undibacterium sp. 20NA77.5]